MVARKNLYGKSLKREKEIGVILCAIKWLLFKHFKRKCGGVTKSPKEALR